MMFTRRFLRVLPVDRLYCSLATKSPLAVLRKKTGYAFSSCKKALELHGEDLETAEKWLHEQAQAMGWEKAHKLRDRKAIQGLIGLSIRGNDSVLSEINCETDFVAKNEDFRQFVRSVTATCMQLMEHQQSADAGSFTKIALDAGQMNNLRVADDKTLADQTALIIGNISENIRLRRSFGWHISDPSIRVYSYMHPCGDKCHSTGIQLGRIGALLALRSTLEDVNDVDDLGRNICQHIVAMNPRKIGDYDKDKPMALQLQEEREAHKRQQEDNDEEVGQHDDGKLTLLPDEPCLIYQNYILEENMGPMEGDEARVPVTVGQILLETGLEVVDFKRFECGEDFETLDHVQTCQ